MKYPTVNEIVIGNLPEINVRDGFVAAIDKLLIAKTPHNKKSVEKLAATYGITDKTQVKELTELAIVKRARILAHSEGTIRERFDKIVDLYHSQVNLSHRTSQSILLQQYSTPAPIAYLAGVFCELHLAEGFGFEPSAGNGLLTIAGKPETFIVNEIDPVRNANLQVQGFTQVLKRDATKQFNDLTKKFDAVLTNPPFGVMESKVMFDTFPIKPLEHVMALRALDCMKDSGKAAIIIGGHTTWDDEGRIQKGKNRIFFNYLYSRYNVVDVIMLDGHKLYSRQGTSFDVRLILIAGRKPAPAGNAPVYNPHIDVVVKTFDELFDRVMDAMDIATHNSSTINENNMRLLELEAEALELELQLLKTNFEKSLGAIIPGNINQRTYERYLEYKRDTLQHFKILVLVKKPLRDEYETFDMDADRLVYMCSVPFTLFSIIKGKKVYGINITGKRLEEIKTQLQKAGYIVIAAGDEPEEELGAPYEPASESCVVLNTQVPDSMAYETHSAVKLIKQEVGGDIDNFVRDRLKYPSKAALCKVLSAEQIDAVAMCIYNIEARNQGCIIGDQTGIGKGRIAAAMIRYGVMQGKTPVFLTEKANLFSDIYRDLNAIGSGHLKPFIVNNKESKTDIKDEDGNIVYQAPPPTEQQNIFESRQVPSKYDFVLATYTQFNSAEKKPVKPNFLTAMAEDNIFIMDEAHNSSGSSNTGEFMQGVIRLTKGVVFLSATFAKRPDNMPIYAMKTAIADCNMTRDDLVDAITKGGVALQEVLSSQLVAEGQMIRRERSYEGIEVNYITLDNKAQEHKAIADNITEVLRDIISFQAKYVDKEVEGLDKIAAAEAKEVQVREGTSKAGVDNTPYFSKIFNVINQMLFSLKAEAVAERAIERLKEGKKTVIAFASTMGSFIETMENATGMPVGDGDTIDADFAEVLRRGLEGIMRYTVKDIDGRSEYKNFPITDFPPVAQMEYQRISERIESISTGITISPIDIVIRKIKQAGYSVAEVTGRKFELQLDKNGRKALVLSRKRINTNDAFRMFNNNEVDVLMINQSGSTGASAHAIPTAKIPKDQVKQRVMIVLQAELDISTEVQKRGRINRTGQILKPIYDYVTSAIPAEKRLMMMLQKKLKSLDANTTSNQKQSSKILDVPDFLNKYGDKIVQEYLADNPEVNLLLDDPLNLEDSGSDSGSKTPIEEGAMKVSGRVAVLSTQMQEDFYTDISERYNDYVEYLKQVGEYDLEVEAMNLEAETVSAKVFKMGKGTDSAFGDDSTLETVKANVLKKPFAKIELENILTESLKGENPKTLQQQFLQEYNTEVQNKFKELAKEVDEKYEGLIRDIPTERSIKKLEGDPGAWDEAIKERTKELNEARDAQHIKNERIFENRSSALKKALNYFYIGRYVSYPIKTFGSDGEIVPAVFLGYLIDRKKKNPYAPSAIKLRFAIANSSKYLAIPASYSQDIMSIIGASVDLKEVDIPTLLEGWHKYIQDRSADRSTRHIITGNLLQAFSDQKGKLVSYSTSDGQVKKGILMAEHWDPGEQIKDTVVVPIINALPIIRSLISGKQIITNNGLSFFKKDDYFKLVISASRSKGGDIYLDKEILPLVEGNNFEKVSDKMVAILPEKNLNRLIEVLQQNHSCSITIETHRLKDINKESIRNSNRKRIQLPSKEEPQEVNTSAGKLRILELEAEALELELLLLAA